MKGLHSTLAFVLTMGILSVALPSRTVTAAVAGDIVINEVLASNGSILPQDPQGQYEDWIELYNRDRQSVSVAGYYLTDDPTVPRKWRIPAGASTTLATRTYLIIWADGDTTATGLHASFQLGSDSGGVYLFAPDGVTLLDSVEYEQQTTNVSYGRYPDGMDTLGFMQPPTPGATNQARSNGKAADVQYSRQRGFYEAPFDLTLSCDTPGAAVFYTLDGRQPYDLVTRTPTGTLYTGPITISTTTCVRACAVKSNWIAGNMAAHTYIFLEDVRNQATNPSTGAQVVPEGLPTTWPGGSTTGPVAGNYQVDPDVVGLNGKDKFGGLYAQSFKDDMKAVPTVSLFMNMDDWFGTTGIYVNESLDGTERACSLEWIDPNTGSTFQINCAVAMQGGVTSGGTSLRRWKLFKLSMRPRFKTTLDNGTPTGGPSELSYQIFPDSPTEIFDTFVLDGLLANTWNHSDGTQNTHPNYLEDQFTCDLHNAMGGGSPHGRYVHVYINGMYWGMYCLHERPDHSWAAQTFGGNKEEYDAIRHNANTVVNDAGPGKTATASYNAMVAAATAVGNDPTNMTKYNTLCQVLDIDNFITCLLAHWFALNWDWPTKNWYATHSVVDGLWRFHVWDAEHALEYWNGQNVWGLSESSLHDKLKGNTEYRMRFADLAHRFFFNGGVLTDPAVADRYRTRIAEIDRAIVGESARWGDTRRPTTPGTRADWVTIQNGILTDFIQPRSAKLLTWLKNNSLYPSVAAPVFNVNGTYQHGGRTPAHAALSMTAPTGEVWYTLDGSDPRTPGSVAAVSDVALVPESAAKRVLIPTAAISDAWRGGAAFDDTAWTLGTGGVGYDNSVDYKPYFKIDVYNQMYGKNPTCYIRIPFTVDAAEVDKLSTLTLNVRYDDGFVAYINGTEVARKNCTGTPAWNTRAGASNSDAFAVDLEGFDLTASVGKLVAGQNLLALQGLNESATSSDFLISVELKAIKGATGTPGGNSAGALRYTSPIALAGSATVKARALSGATWSALNEATYAVGPVAESLRISEIMYHPIDTGNPDDPNTEYIELTNIGSARINLNMAKFTRGVDFVFPNVELAPKACTLVVRDVTAFAAKYGANLPIAGQYAGNLSNGGERIELQDAVGQTIESFRYDDKWHDLTDGMGYSLTVRDPAADPNSLSDESLWRPSVAGGGSPGYDDSSLVSEQ